MEAGRLEECAALVFEAADPDEDLWGARLNGATANTVESLIRLGRYDEASSLLGETGERAAGTCGTTRPLLRAMVAMRRGRLDHAGELLARTVAAAPGQRGGTCPPRHQALAATCAAERSRLHGSDPERWDDAARRWAAAGEPYPDAYCRWREAEALLEQRAGRNRAGDRLQEAWQTSVAMGADPLREQIERLAQRARIPLAAVDQAPTTSTVADDLGLTPREVEVLGELAAGRTDREIADRLFISKKTVSVHVSNLLRKLEVTNRVEGGRIGQAHGCA
jgi:DNA-binding CsgD family transcriptional regulator